MTTSKDLNPRTTHYEFFGPIGTFILTVTTPLTTYFLYYLCNDTPDAKLYKFTSLNTYCNWFAVLALLWYVIPGPWTKGTELRNGTTLDYKLNGFRSLLVILSLVAAGLAQDSKFLEFLYHDYLSFITASLIFSFGIALWSHLNSIASGSHVPLLAEGGNSGSFPYDFWMGRNLNPRVRSFDIKVFCELRPGLFLWLILDLACAAHQYNTFGRITESMFLVCFFHAWYVIDSVWNEGAVLTTMDVTTDGFGFMLAFGDLTWVPFTYCLQARYLAQYPLDLGAYALLILAIQFLGFYIFRSANSQKDHFRSYPDHPRNKAFKSIQTKRGTKLLADGWWGRARHVNYLGDWIMAWSWCLTTGFSSPVPYFYVIYFAILLIHRERRDEEKCAKKYGEDWLKYKALVKYRIVPWVY